MKLKLKEKIIFALLVIGGIAVLFLPDFKKHPKVLKPDFLFYQLNQKGRFVSPDDLAKSMISKDPTLMLIDVRTKKDYDKFTLPGALNIPLDSILNSQYVDYLDQDVYKTILFSNGTSLADQAWMILKSNGYNGSYVLDGGLNNWFKTIIDPEKPSPEAEMAEREKYEFRKGASLFFTGVSSKGVGGTSDSKPKPKAAAVPMVKRKKKEVSGGCG
jgi:rhodanese-related sulfurtransferase